MKKEKMVDFWAWLDDYRSTYRHEPELIAVWNACKENEKTYLNEIIKDRASHSEIERGRIIMESKKICDYCINFENECTRISADKDLCFIGRKINTAALKNQATQQGIVPDPTAPESSKLAVSEVCADCEGRGWYSGTNARGEQIHVQCQNCGGDIK